MKKKLLFFPLLGLMLSGCSVDDLMFWKQKEDETKENKETPSQQENQSKPADGQGTNTDGGSGDKPVQGEFSATILTSGSVFAEAFTDRTQFTGNTGAEKLETYLKSQLSNKSYLTEFSCDTSQAITYKDTRILQIGSSSANGFFTWTSQNVLIYSVEATVMTYTKYDTTNEIWRTDTETHFKIDEVDEALTVNDSNEPVEHIVKKDYEDGTTQFTLAQTGGRAFVKQIKITWIGL